MQERKRKREKVEYTRNDFLSIYNYNTIIGLSEVIAMLKIFEYNYEKDKNLRRDKNKENEMDNFLR